MEEVQGTNNNMPSGEETSADVQADVQQDINANDGKGKKAKKQKKPNAVVRVLDGFFQLTERGSNVKTEIYAGILMFFEVAAFLMIGALMLAGGTNLTTNYYYAVYFATGLISAISSILIGILCNVPLVQSTSLGLISLMVSIYGANTGLTFTNLMAISFVGNLVYFVVMVIPPVRNFIARGIPSSVRKAMPAAIGVFLIMFALLQLNVLSIEHTSFMDFLEGQATTMGTMSVFGVTKLTVNFDVSDGANWYVYMPIISAMVGFVLMLVLKHYKLRHATIFAFLGAFVFYVVMWLIRGDFRDYWFFSFVTPSYAEMYWYKGMPYVLGLFKNISLGVFEKHGAFRSGFDFSGYIEALQEAAGEGVAVNGGWHVFLLFFTSAISITLLGVCETGAAVTACGYFGNSLDEDGKPTNISQRKYRVIAPFLNVYSVNAISSVAGCLLGSGPVVARAESAVGSSEGGRSGLSAIIAGLLLIITVFTTALAGLFMNGAIVYGIVIFVGLTLLLSLKNCDFTSISTALPFLTTIVVVGLTMDFAKGVVLGILAESVIKLLSLKFKEFKIETIVVSILCLAALILC